jgi:hypothetical protein
MIMNTNREVTAVRALTRLHFSPVTQNLPDSAAVWRDLQTTKAWGWRENIVGFGVGLKRTAGKTIKDQPCVTIYVKRKVAVSRIPAGRRVPALLTLDSHGVEVATDIVELRGRPTAQAGQVRPVQPGVSIGHKSAEVVGTLGLLVRRTGESKVLALSCSHVLARSGYDVAIGDEIEQPIEPSENPAVNQIGSLDSFSTIVPGHFANSEDFALAALSVEAAPEMIDTGLAVGSYLSLSASQFKVGTHTLRNGAGTGVRTGRVKAFQSTWTIQMPFVGTTTFKEVVAYDTVCGEGDSGAAVLDESGTVALGLHFAGSPPDKLGLFLPIGSILEDHGLEIFSG